MWVISLLYFVYDVSYELIHDKCGFSAHEQYYAHSPQQIVAKKLLASYYMIICIII